MSTMLLNKGLLKFTSVWINGVVGDTRVVCVKVVSLYEFMKILTTRRINLNKSSSCYSVGLQLFLVGVVCVVL